MLIILVIAVVCLYFALEEEEHVKKCLERENDPIGKFYR